MRTLVVAVLSCLLALTGCEKSGSKGAGPLGGEDAKLLADLPGGNIGIFGGNYMKLQNFMQSAIGGMVKHLADKAGAGSGFETWMKCFTEFKNLRIVGGLAAHPDGAVDGRIAMSGMSLQDIAGCAKRAGMQMKLDGDGKFISVDMPMMGETMTMTYLQLADGAVYTRQEVALGGIPVTKTLSRAELEADAETAKKTSAAGDKQLVAIAAKADHSETVWFAVSGENTGLSDKLGEAYGAVDLESGFAIDATVQIKDAALADKAEQGYKQMKDMAAAAPGDMKSVIEAVHLERKGDHLHVAIKLDDAQMKALSSFLGSMSGAL